MAGIYIHIPFCRKACHYCDFHFSTSLANREKMVTALCKELESRATSLSNQKIETIYFGGGTPSVLLKKEIERIIQTIHTRYDVDTEIECTLEANPDDCSIDNLADWLNSGINRLSVGVQSFRQADLDWMNRSHNATQAIQSIHDAGKVGFAHINLDLIYGVPSMPFETWKSNVDQAFKLPINHISAYSLTVEKGTALHHFVQTNKYPDVNEDKSANEFEYFLEQIKTNGWEQYEISNYCTPGNYAKHNTNYWKQKAYIGVGPSAHSYGAGIRRWNVANNAKYLRAIETNEHFYEEEQLSKTDQINELIMLGLRTKWGVHIGKLKQEHQYDLLDQANAEIADFVRRGKLVHDGDTLRLTEAGRLMADHVASTLFTVE